MHFLKIFDLQIYILFYLRKEPGLTNIEQKFLRKLFYIELKALNFPDGNAKDVL